MLLPTRNELGLPMLIIGKSAEFTALGKMWNKSGWLLLIKHSCVTQPS